MTDITPALAEIWQRYAPAPPDHATLLRLEGMASQARIVNDGGMSNGISLQNWLAVSLHDARGKLTGLAHFPPTHGQRLEYLPLEYPIGGQVINKPQQGGEVVYIVADPKEGYKIAHAGLPCVITFTPRSLERQRPPHA